MTEPFLWQVDLSQRPRRSCGIGVYSSRYAKVAYIDTEVTGIWILEIRPACIYFFLQGSDRYLGIAESAEISIIFRCICLNPGSLLDTPPTRRCGAGVQYHL